MRKGNVARQKKDKLERLEKKIAEASVDADLEGGRKRRYDDNEFLEECREITENVRSAVTAGKTVFFLISQSLNAEVTWQVFGKRERKPVKHQPQLRV